MQNFIQKHKLLVKIIAILVVLMIVKNPIIKTVVLVGGKSTLGTDMKIGRFSLSFITQKLVMRDMKIYSPKPFDASSLVILPRALIVFFKVP